MPKEAQYTKEEVMAASKQYFNGDELAAKVFAEKYALCSKNGEVYYEDTPDMMHRRIAKEFARIEKDKFSKPLSEDVIYNMLKDFKYIVPQGSPMFGIGNNEQIISLSNCFLLENPIDTYSSILQTDQQLVNITKRRGGCGVDLSNLRPEKAPTTNAARTSSGIPTWMERYSHSIREVGQNGRRGALLLSLSVHHPDIIKFCKSKLDSTKITGANISVRLTREFMNAVKNNEKYELRFPVDAENPTISQMVSAKEVWDTIIDSAWQCAEPGLLMWDNVQENTPADCYERYASKGANPCAEIVLSELDSCRLLALNLYSFVEKPFTADAKFDFASFYKYAKYAQRLMDDLVDLESEKIGKILEKIDSDPEPEEIKRNERELWTKIKRTNDEGRRTGTGITALGDTLAALGARYGSKRSVELVDCIYGTLKLGCYESSVEMARELGPFVGYSAEAEKYCPFIKRIATELPDLYRDMTLYGRRNVALLTTAPTGSLSMMTQTSSGIEPVFKLSYTRRKKVNNKTDKVCFTDANGDMWEEFEVNHPKVEIWREVTGGTDLTLSPWYGACAEDLDWQQRVEIQAAAQKHVCHSISSTVNLPEDVEKEVIAKIYQTAFDRGCKGMTVYRNGCRSGVLIDTPKEEEQEAPKKAEYLKPMHLPEIMPSIRIKQMTPFGHMHIKIIVDPVSGYEREVFATLGKGGDVACSDLEAICRMISLYLRCNGSLRDVIRQLDGIGSTLSIPTKDGRVVSLADAIAKALKKYLMVKKKEGLKALLLGTADLTPVKKGIKKAVKDTSTTGYNVACPECGGTIQFLEGCQKCNSCGYSKC